MITHIRGTCAGGTTAWKMCSPGARSSLALYFDITAAHAAAVPDGTPFFLQVRHLCAEP